MRTLVVNSGSSSIKFSVFENEAGGADPQAMLDGEISGVGGDGARLRLRKTGGDKRDSQVDADSPEAAMHAVVDALGDAPVDAVGYRVVHPGPKLREHVRVTDEVLAELERASEFAPLHDPEAVTIIRTMMSRLPGVPHFACFDTVFHETMPEEATTYAIPERYRAAGVRRYGFHGLSCESIVRQVRQATGGFPRRCAIAHLGSGCSVTALVDGKSVDNTMGLTPTGGVVMGTRPGDLDPGLVLFLLRHEQNESAAGVEKTLNHEAGMVALSGMPNDVRKVREAAAQGDAKARLALSVFTRSVRKAIGSYAWLLGGLDAVIFAGGIGEHDAETRSEVLGGLEEFGIVLDAGANGAPLSKLRVSGEGSKVEVWVVPAEEDRMIAVHVGEMMGG